MVIFEGSPFLIVHGLGWKSPESPRSVLRLACQRVLGQPIADQSPMPKRRIEEVSDTGADARRIACSIIIFKHHVKSHIKDHAVSGDFPLINPPK